MIVAIAFVLSACTSLPPNASRQTHPGSLQGEFQRAHPPPGDTDYAACETPWENHTGITEIDIERTPCYVFCSTYTLRLFSDGRVEYTGQASVPFVGTRRGKLDSYFFAELARAAVGIGFFQFQDRYACGVTDNPTVYVAVTRSGQRKIIEHYAPDSSGPPALRLFEKSIDDVQQYIKWSGN